MLTALLGLAERSQDPREKWAYNRRVIDEFTASGTSYLSWYVGAHQDMLRLAKQDRTLVKKADLDKLIERCPPNPFDLSSDYETGCPKGLHGISQLSS